MFTFPKKLFLQFHDFIHKAIAAFGRCDDLNLDFAAKRLNSQN